MDSVIKFITEGEEKKSPVFGDVKCNQFFVDQDGYLCQKVMGGDNSWYTYVSRSDGTPYAGSWNNVGPNTPISRTLPIVTKIEF